MGIRTSILTLSQFSSCNRPRTHIDEMWKGIDVDLHFDLISSMNFRSHSARTDKIHTHSWYWLSGWVKRLNLTMTNVYFAWHRTILRRTSNRWASGVDERGKYACDPDALPMDECNQWQKAKKKHKQNVSMRCVHIRSACSPMTWRFMYLYLYYYIFIWVDVNDSEST